MPLSTLFLNPTVEGLANALNPETNTLTWSPLVAIQPKGSNPPFFCVHPIFGVVFQYYKLAFHLGKDQPFYGLQPRGMDGKFPPFNRIEDIAAHYIEAMREVQPNGPYFIGGWSFGGLVAFEMAQQLVKAGDEVGLLAILDTGAPIAENQPTFWESWKFLFTIAGRYIWPFLLDYIYLVTTLGESRRRILSELTILPMLRIYQANSQAVLNYLPQVYPGRITLFRSSEQTSIAHQDPTMGWNSLSAEGVEVCTVPGNHLTMLRKPNVEVFAERLRETIHLYH